jgi:hypothetical protein
MPLYPTHQAQHISTMTTDVMSKQIPVLCDYDALFAAIELKLSALPQVQVLRLESNHPRSPESHRPTDEFDLIIVAPVPPIRDPMSILSRASLLSRVGQVPILIISEQPSRPESDEKITFLNFPFDMDDLTDTVAGILERRHYSAPERAC